MNEVTRVLSAMEGGDPHAADQLLPLVYNELRRLAAQKLAHEKPGQTLEATALVHEAYLRLVDVEKAQHWNSRAHFYAAAAEAMRRILVERARSNQRHKRGGGAQRQQLDDQLPGALDRVHELLAVHKKPLLLAVAVVALLLSAGVIVKAQRDARQAQLSRGVNEALNQATALRERAKAASVGSAALFARAREQMQRALALVEDGLDDATLVAQVSQLQAELDAEEKDRTLVAALDEAWLAQAETLSENRFASERAVPKIREAFRTYGLAPEEGEPAAVAERIRRRSRRRSSPPWRSGTTWPATPRYPSPNRTAPGCVRSWRRLRQTTLGPRSCGLRWRKRTGRSGGSLWSSWPRPSTCVNTRRGP